MYTEKQLIACKGSVLTYWGLSHTVKTIKPHLFSTQASLFKCTNEEQKNVFCCYIGALLRSQAAISAFTSWLWILAKPVSSHLSALLDFKIVVRTSPSCALLGACWPFPKKEDAYFEWTIISFWTQGSWRILKGLRLWDLIHTLSPLCSFLGSHCMRWGGAILFSGESSWSLMSWSALDLRLTSPWPPPALLQQSRVPQH